MGKTTIEWTTRLIGGKQYPGYTFNGWIGCTKYDEGCTHCYAETLAKRAGKNWGNVQWGVGQERYRVRDLDKPYEWNRRAAKEGVWRYVFANSMSDVFDPEVPDVWRQDFFKMVANCRNLCWLLLTKRSDLVMASIEAATGFTPAEFFHHNRHVMIGHSISSQKALDWRIPHILEQIMARAKVFYSAEPLIESVDFRLQECPIDWLILGGESGPKARPCDVQWLRSGLSQGVAESIPVLIKQLGSNSISPDTVGRQKGKGNKLESLPEGLRVREHPLAVKHVFQL